MSQPLPSAGRVRRVEIVDRVQGSALGAIEALAGFVFVCFIAVLVVTGFGIMGLRPLLMNDQTMSLPSKVALALGAMLVVVAECASVAFYKRSMSDVPDPIPVGIAMRQCRWPACIRPIAVAWWLAHAVVLFWFAHKWFADMTLLESDTSRRALVWVGAFLLFLPCSYAANVHILLAVAAVWSEETFLRLIWRARLVFDVVLTATLTLVAFWV